MNFIELRLSEKSSLEKALYIVPTPIGNLEDITLRAYKILRDIEIIACEDTRRIGNLLKIFGLPNKKLISYHSYNENDKIEQIINIINQNNSVALVSDAGTPCISDPGYRLINFAIENNIKIVSLPGATALIPALVASGFPTNEFIFVGFPPQKKGRKSFIENNLKYNKTTIFYESTHRIVKFLEEIQSFTSPYKEICVAKEISKLHENYLRGRVSEIIKQINVSKTSQGEFVIIV